MAKVTSVFFKENVMRYLQAGEINMTMDICAKVAKKTANNRPEKS